MEYNNFIKEWFKRAERKNRCVDDADRFISLWIAFNGWLKNEYGENIRDCEMIKSAKKNRTLKSTFRELSNSNNNFKKILAELKGYSVTDARCPSNEQKEKSCTGDYGSFLDTIYQIRCNLFHGRKNVDENKIDRKLVTLALKLLHPLFKKLLDNHCVN